MYRLAHISDIHFSPLPEIKIWQLANKRITGYLNWKINRKGALKTNHLHELIADMKQKSPDHIAVTGDLVNLALPQEFINTTHFLEGLGKPKDVTAICGNHDAYLRGSMKSAIQNWHNFLCDRPKENLALRNYPFYRPRGDIAIIACNSAEPTLPFMATGYFRQEQAIRLGNLLEQTKDMCRVVLIHHPPFQGATKWHKRLVGIDLFQSVIKQYGAELVLHGHTHQATRNTLEGPDGDVPLICVSAAGQAKDTPHHPAGRYNLFEIEKNQSKWSIRQREFGKNTTGDIEELGNYTLS